MNIGLNVSTRHTVMTRRGYDACVEPCVRLIIRAVVVGRAAESLIVGDGCENDTADTQFLAGDIDGWSTQLQGHIWPLRAMLGCSNEDIILGREIRPTWIRGVVRLDRHSSICRGKDGDEDVVSGGSLFAAEPPLGSAGCCKHPCCHGTPPELPDRKTRASIELPDSGLSRFVLSGL